MRIIAALVILSQVLALGTGWTAAARAPYDGIVRAGRALHVPGALTIVALAPGGPTDRAGLQPGDVILGVDDVPASDLAGYMRALASWHAGEVRTLHIWRLGVGAPDQIADVPVALQSQLVRPVVLAASVAVALTRSRDRTARLLLLVGAAISLSLALRAWHYARPPAWLAHAPPLAVVLGSAALALGPASTRRLPAVVAAALVVAAVAALRGPARHAAAGRTRWLLRLAVGALACAALVLLLAASGSVALGSRGEQLLAILAATAWALVVPALAAVLQSSVPAFITGAAVRWTARRRGDAGIVRAVTVL